MTRCRIQELLGHLNEVISDSDLVSFPELKIALDKIEQKHSKNLQRYHHFLGKKYTLPYKDMIGKVRKTKGTISEICNFYEDEVIVKVDLDGTGAFEYWKLGDLEDKK